VIYRYLSVLLTTLHYCFYVVFYNNMSNWGKGKCQDITMGETGGYDGEADGKENIDSVVEILFYGLKSSTGFLYNRNLLQLNKIGSPLFIKDYTADLRGIAAVPHR
jgi:hypothetical protein